MMDTRLIAVALSVLIISAAAVAGVLVLLPYNPEQPPLADENGSTAAGIRTVVDANNRFAFDILSELDRDDSSNAFFSPYSIFSAMAMVFEGARGQTSDEMAAVFHYPVSEVLGPNFAAVYNSVNRGDGSSILKTGNALWAQQDYPFLEDYLSLVESRYGGKAANLYFVRETEESRKTINGFIEQQTDGRIRDLIPAGILDPLTRLVLTNAIYFRGTWTWQFDKAATRNEDFFITRERTVSVPMMFMDNDKAKFSYADLGDLQILELPYKGDRMSMLIILPNGSIESIRPSLTADKLKEWKATMRASSLDAIYLPRFGFDTKYFLKDALVAMGMPTAFSDDADFSGMDGTRNLSIGSVIHQAFVKVDEEGTEAAAATAVIMQLSSALPRKVFRADRPFIFIIQEKATGAILFMGKVIDPSA